MKTSMTILLAALMSWQIAGAAPSNPSPTPIPPPNPEFMKFHFALGVVKCTLQTGQNTPACEGEHMKGPTPDTEIVLNNCHLEPKGRSLCTGTWTTTASRDEHTFQAWVVIERMIHEDGSADYTLVSRLGSKSDSIPLTSINVLLKHGKLTDSVIFSSNEIPGKKEANGATVSYMAFLAIDPPAAPTPPGAF